MSLAPSPHGSWPRLVGREVAASYIGVCPNTFDKMVRDGVMPRPRLLGGKRKAWDVRELDIAVDQLPHDGEELAASDEGWT